MLDSWINNIVIIYWYIPGLCYNIYSEKKGFADLGIHYTSAKSRTLVDNCDNIIGYIFKCSEIPFIKQTDRVLISVSIAITPLVAYRRLVYVGIPIRKSNKDWLDKAIEDDTGLNGFNCEIYKLGKSKRIVSRTPQIQAKKAGDCIYIDLQQVKPIEISGAKYLLVIIDNATRCWFTILLKSKKETLPMII